MNTTQLVWKNITQQIGSTFLSILLTALGIAILCVIYITGDSFEKQLSSNTKNVDLVVGAKGSPLQLILSTLYHVDNPTGNIALEAGRTLGENPFIELAVPISLGDNYKGHRLVGTEASYLSLYELTIQEGQIWDKPFEVVIGSQVAEKQGLKIGDTFHTAHGLSAEGHVHDDHPFVIVGILEQSKSIVDNLILCNLESVWDVHGIQHDDADHHNKEEHVHDHEHDHEHHEHETSSTPNDDEEVFVSEKPSVFVKNIGQDMIVDRGNEVTALLIKYASPAAISVVPRLVNESTDMQAASPAIESSRLFSLLGVGLDSLAILAYVIMIIAGLSVFISLYNALKERKYDLAVMRSIGASKSKLFSLVILEGLVITFIGSVVGLLLGHIALYLINQQTSESIDLIEVIALNKTELLLILVACFIGMLAALIPAIKAYRTSISSILSEK